MREGAWAGPLRCDWEEYLMQWQAGRCFYCFAVFDEELANTMDHVVPFSLGGAHVLENIVLACLACNAKKGGKPLVQFLTEQEAWNG